MKQHANDVDSLCEYALNLLRGHVRLNPKQKKKTFHAQAPSARSNKRMARKKKGHSESKRRLRRSSSRSRLDVYRTAASQKLIIMTALQHAKKMVLIDPRELDKVNAVVRDNDLPGNTVRGIYSDMKKILDRTELSAFDKMQLYGQALQRYLRMNTLRGKQSLNITLTSEGKKPPKK